ncbi:hypothetical protein O3W44_22860 [Pantoea sp. LMR881]|uniref:hypothetical protein n=1 Tax=Pantoea sp. LMR881 TaxID=3014336 RepID=UPI0022AFE0C0|nr:hypothetical protein [Pantoea sp. LMR881]MCZ4061374.1 hypothetical protein [Pantoea sp. LMR881]
MIDAKIEVNNAISALMQMESPNRKSLCHLAGGVLSQSCWISAGIKPMDAVIQSVSFRTGRTQDAYRCSHKHCKLSYFSMSAQNNPTSRLCLFEVLNGWFFNAKADMGFVKTS